MPRIVLASLFVIWFGLGMSSKVATAFVLVFFAVFFNAFQGAREVDRNLVNNARILGAEPHAGAGHDRRAQRHLLDPRLLHSAFGFALIGAVVGEYSGADKGLGLLDHPRPGHLRLRRDLRRNDHHHGDRAARRVAARPCSNAASCAGAVSRASER